MHNVYITGKSYSGVSNGFDIITVKYDSTGTQLWDKNFNGSSNDHDVSEAIDLDADGNVYVLGTSVNSTTAEDFQLIKYDTAGTQLWEKKYTYSNAAGSQEYAMALFVDELNNIYAAGMSALDYAIVKYSQTAVGVEEVQAELAVRIFPNPSGGNFMIDNPKNDKPLYLNVYNVLGSVIYQSKIIDSKSQIDLSAQPNGVYFLAFSNSQTRFTTKIVIQH
jgi:hypothetical protein